MTSKVFTKSQNGTRPPDYPTCTFKKKYETRIIVAALGRGTSDIAEVVSGNICFVFGNEDKGISRRVLSIADANVRIPISKTIDSLNVASASAVCLYEASRYREDTLNR